MRKIRLHCDHLEDRLAPAITVLLDFSRDSNNFFNTAESRATVQTAVNAIASQLNDTLLAIPSPTGSNTWQARFSDPGTGQNVAITDLVVPQNTLLVFVGGRSIPGSTIGFAQTGFGVSGSSAWLALVEGRGQAGAVMNPETDVGPWGGSITFDTGANFFTGTDLSQIQPGQVSLFLTAQHEFGHILGLGASGSWDRLVNGNNFVGAASQQSFGGPVPLEDDGHFQDGLMSGGNAVVMTATQESNGANGVSFTPLDFAALTDIGWQVGAATSPPPTTTPPTTSPPTTTPPVTIPPVTIPPVTIPPSPVIPPTTTIPPGVGQSYLVGSGVGSAAQFSSFRPNGTIGVGSFVFDSRVTGGVRTASGDIDRDGVADIILGAGPGGAPEVRVLKSNTINEIFRFNAFESSFTGGVYVASGDFNQDGVADIVVSPDEGGGPRIRVISGTDGSTVLADFFGIDDPNFRGGARVAVGDINGDNFPDLLVGAGFGGGPRLAAFDGRTLLSNRVKLFGDFFVFEETLRNGVFLTSGDLNGDNFDELIVGGGPGGGPRVFALSGFALATSNGTNQVQVANFFAGDSNNRGGVRLAVGNLDGDNRADLITGAGPGSSNVTTYLGANIPTNGTPPVQNSFDAFPGLTGGVFVG